MANTSPSASRRRRAVQHAAKKSAPAADTPAFYLPESWSPEESIGYLMRRILSHVTDAVDDELEPTGLTHAQWMPLLKLYMGASTVAELARQSNLDAGAMTRALDRLEAKSLVKRVRSSEDRRVVNLELTAEGRAVAKQIPTVLCRVQNVHMRGFSEAEWQLLKGLLRRILDTAIDLQQEREQGKSPQ
jgi:DNA-binding MarR family transcriptional regulator